MSYLDEIPDVLMPCDAERVAIYVPGSGWLLPADAAPGTPEES